MRFSVFPSPKDADEINLSLSFPPGVSVEQAQEISTEVENKVLEELGDNIERVSYFNANNENASLSITLTQMEDRDISARELVDKINNSLLDYDNARVKAFIQSAGPPPADYQFTMQIFAKDQEILKNLSEDISEYIRQIDLEGDAEVTEVATSNLSNVSKIDGKRYAEVRAKVSEPDNTALALEIEDKVKEEYNDEKLSEYGLDTDALSFDFGQESDNIASFNSLLFFQAVSLILMYGLLVFQYNSFSQPLLIFLAIPLSFPGLFPGLYLNNNAMSFFVLLGITGLIGIVVNNSIMLVDFANQARAEGKGIVESISEAVRIRFRPLITTSITTIVGVLPLALTDPFWEPLILSIVFGLIASTTLVIFAFPSFYAIVEYLRGQKTKYLMKLKTRFE